MGSSLDALCVAQYRSVDGRKGPEDVAMSSFHGPDLGPFQWDDPLLLEGQLTEDERMIRDTARDFAAKELAPRVPESLSRGKDRP